MIYCLEINLKNFIQPKVHTWKYVKKNECVLNPSTTSRYTIFIVVRLADLRHIKKLQFHTQLGHMIEKYDVDVNRDRCYLILSIILVNKEMHKHESIIIGEDLPLLESFYINQIAIKKGNYHFDTTGTIYGLGYGPTQQKNVPYFYLIIIIRVLIRTFFCK